MLVGGRITKDELSIIFTEEIRIKNILRPHESNYNSEQTASQLIFDKKIYLLVFRERLIKLFFFQKCILSKMQRKWQNQNQTTIQCKQLVSKCPAPASPICASFAKNILQEIPSSICVFFHIKLVQRNS